MNVFGLIGHPLGHSFSQKYFTEKFQRERLDCRYDNFDISNEIELYDLLKNHSEIIGFNITSPYKEIILSYIDYYNDIVNEIKSANTIKRLPNGKLAGYNTDVIGFDKILQGVLEQDALPMTALVFGSGGASKAVQWVLRQHHIDYDLVSRDPRHGNYTYNSILPETIESHRLLINATPLGTFPNIETAPNIPYQAITSKHHLIDLVYNPEETSFLRKGKEKGASITNGLTMLYAQAEASWEIWNASPSTPYSPSPPAPLPRERGGFYPNPFYRD